MTTNHCIINCYGYAIDVSGGNSTPLECTIMYCYVGFRGGAMGLIAAPAWQEHAEAGRGGRWLSAYAASTMGRYSGPQL